MNGAIHPLDDVRGLQEEHKGDWTVIVREHLIHTLLRTGYVSAEDFDALGVPAEHSNLPNAQMGSYSKLQYMEKGRRELSKLAGVGAGKRSKSAAGLDSTESPVSPAPISPDPGECSTGGRGQARKSIGGPADSTSGVATPETLSLFPDSEAWAA